MTTHLTLDKIYSTPKKGATLYYKLFFRMYEDGKWSTCGREFEKEHADFLADNMQTNGYTTYVKESGYYYGK